MKSMLEALGRLCEGRGMPDVFLSNGLLIDDSGCLPLDIDSANFHTERPDLLYAILTRLEEVRGG